MKTLLLLALALAPAVLFTQNCQRDSSLLVTGALFSPAPWTPDAPYYNLKPACIEEPYNQSVTINVQPFITVSGVAIPVSSISIPTAGAIQNLPAGLSYSCDPPNCVFNANTLGCMLLYGTPVSSNTAPDTLDLIIGAVVVSPLLGPIPVTFPNNGATPDDHYYLILRPTGQCTVSGAVEPAATFGAARALPNPFSGQTSIELQSAQAGNARFEVFDLFGRPLHGETLQLAEGENQFPYDGSLLPDGAYFFSLSNSAGRTVWRMIKG